MKKALVLSLAVVLGLGIASFAQTLSGEWYTEIGIKPNTLPIGLTITSDLSILYSVSGWDFGTALSVDAAGLTAMAFEVDGSLGAFSIGSKLVFDPVAVAFDYWNVNGGLSLAGVSFTADFTLADGSVSLDLIGAGTAGLVDVTVTVSLGNAEPDGVDPVCDFNFDGVSIDVGFPFCCAEVNALLIIDCDGFESITFSVDDISLPAASWLTLGADLKFTTTTKELTLTPGVDFGATGCFTIYFGDVGEIDPIDGPAPGIEFGVFDIEGIGIACEIGGVEFEGVSYWGNGSQKPDWLGTYWEGYRLATTDDGCCGPFGFDIAVFFDPNSAELFTIAQINAAFTIQIATQFEFGMKLDLVFADPTQNVWTLTFDVTW